KIVLPFRKDLAEYFIGGAVTTPETWRRTKEIAPALAAYFDENADRIADLIQQHIFDLPAYPKTWGECSEECQKLTWEATVIGLTDLAVELFDGQLVVFTKGSQNPLIETLAKPQGRKVFGIGAYQPFKNFPKI
ncbi:hypothetical protein HN680_00105, partial [Candidatus Peregrinibacteria bacterium]|nr:hypothetical protein [Candidatus Peregrinibacteria bacterium]